MRPKVIAVSGVKNSGKTRLIEGVIPLLSKSAIRVAVIKHDGHSFIPDTPGTDSYRFFSAGACGTAVFDSEKVSVTRRCSVDEKKLIDLFPDANLIILEGFKHSDYPKIELVRSAVSQIPVCDPDTHIAIVSDLNIPTAVPLLSPDDLKGITDTILDFLGKASQ